VQSGRACPGRGLLTGAGAAAGNRTRRVVARRRPAAGVRPAEFAQNSRPGRAPVGALAEERVGGVLVRPELPDLAGPAVADVAHQCVVVQERLAIPPGGHRMQAHHRLIVGDHIVDFDPEGAGGEFHRPAEEAEYGVDTSVVAGQLATVLSALVAIEVPAILIAYPVYGLTYVTSINPHIRRNADLLTTEGMSYRRRPDGIWFWKYERTSWVAR
jgi:hypothetical protein